MILWKDTGLGTSQVDLHFQLCYSLVCNTRGLLLSHSAHVEF